MQKWLLGFVAVAALAAGILLQQSRQADFETLDGQGYQWRDLEGQWVVVNYFAEWCAPCLREVPELNAFAEYAESRDDLALFAVSFDALSEEKLREIQQKYAMQFDLIASLEPVMPNQKPQQLPATYIISPQGEVVKRVLGEQTAQSLIQQLAAL